MRPRCTASIYWWDCDMTAHCHRLPHTDALHFDGVRWFRDDMQYPTPDDAPFVSVKLLALVGAR